MERVYDDCMKDINGILGRGGRRYSSTCNRSTCNRMTYLQLLCGSWARIWETEGVYNTLDQNQPRGTMEIGIHGRRKK
jgi:hypothetical protein